VSQLNKMSSYQWRGTNQSGKKLNGCIQATSATFAKMDLYKQGIQVNKITRKNTIFLNKIKSIDISILSRQLATMAAAGIPLIQSLTIILAGQKKQSMHNLLVFIKYDVGNGLMLAESLKKYPAYFNTLFCNLVEAGEKSGSLESMLLRIAVYKEKHETIKKKIKKALTYPVAILIIALIICASLLLFIVPQFESIFTSFGADLPFSTKSIIALSRFVQSNGHIIFISICIIIAGLIKTKNRYAVYTDGMLLKLPVLGLIVQKACVARFARTLSITIAAGLPIIDALKSVAGATGNLLFAQATDKIRQEITTGKQVHLTMSSMPLFPTLAVQMIAVGEESGTLEYMLNKVADMYEEEVDHAIDALSSLLEPIIMSILGILVGGLVFAMYLPIFKLGSVV